MLQNPSQQLDEANTPRISPLIAGMAGLVAGAAGVTALALSDKDIREKVSKRANEVRMTLQKWSNAKLHEYKAALKKTNGNVTDETIETLTTVEEEKVKN